MKKIIKQVPYGVRFLSDWEDFKLPNYPVIINKVLTGCGFTEFCLNNSDNVILCSPRKMLLENKFKQHKGDLRVYYAKNECDPQYDYEKELSSNKPKISKIKRKEMTKEQMMKFHEGIRNHLMNSRLDQGCKYLVTYDSFRHIREVLGEEIMKSFYVVVDEWQMVFQDSKYKSDTEREFIDTLVGLDKVCFVSATPTSDAELDSIDEFKDLPFWEFDWETLQPGRIVNPLINLNKCSSILDVAKRYVNRYKLGDFPVYSATDSLGNIIEKRSRELVIYVNSVVNICSIIRSCKLTVNNCNVLCAKTDDNRKLVFNAFYTSKAEKELHIGEDVLGDIPDKGEPHKMFTLCTRTVFVGADFYSTCASTLILSDANSESTMLDILLDIPQIIGRQRLDENPWKYSADMYYVTSPFSDDNFETETKLTEERWTKTIEYVEQWRSISSKSTKMKMAEDAQLTAKIYNYRKDYVAVNIHAGSSLEVVPNKYAFVADLRTLGLKKLIYSNKLSVMAAMGNITGGTLDELQRNKLSVFGNFTQFPDKMRYLCDNPDVLENVPIEYQNYYRSLGPERISACQFQKYLLDEEYKNSVNMQRSDSSIITRVQDTFEVGSKYTRKEIKDLLVEIYREFKITSTATAQDISKWFETQDCTKVSNGKQSRALKILKKKD